MTSTSMRNFADERIGELEVGADQARLAAQTRRIHRGHLRDHTRRLPVFKLLEAGLHFLASA